MNRVLGVLAIIGAFLLKVLIVIGKVLWTILKIVLFLIMKHASLKRAKMMNNSGFGH